MRFYCLHGFLAIVFKVPSVKSSKLSQYFESSAIRILNTIIVDFVRTFFFEFWKFVFYAAEKLYRQISLKNEPQLESNIY